MPWSRWVSFELQSKFSSSRPAPCSSCQTLLGKQCRRSSRPPWHSGSSAASSLCRPAPGERRFAGTIRSDREHSGCGRTMLVYYILDRIPVCCLIHTLVFTSALVVLSVQKKKSCSSCCKTALLLPGTLGNANNPAAWTGLSSVLVHPPALRFLLHVPKAGDQASHGAFSAAGRSDQCRNQTLLRLCERQVNRMENIDEQRRGNDLGDPVQHGGKGRRPQAAHIAASFQFFRR